MANIEGKLGGSEPVEPRKTENTTIIGSVSPVGRTEVTIGFGVQPRVDSSGGRVSRRTDVLAPQMKAGGVEGQPERKSQHVEGATSAVPQRVETTRAAVRERVGSNIIADRLSEKTAVDQDALNPWKAADDLARGGDVAGARRAMTQIPDYSDTVRANIDHQIAHANERGEQPVDRDTATALLIDEHPDVPALDALSGISRSIGADTAVPDADAVRLYGVSSRTVDSIAYPQAERGVTADQQADLHRQVTEAVAQNEGQVTAPVVFEGNMEAAPANVPEATVALLDLDPDTMVNAEYAGVLGDAAETVGDPNSTAETIVDALHNVGTYADFLRDDIVGDEEADVSAALQVAGGAELQKISSGFADMAEVEDPEAARPHITALARELHLRAVRVTNGPEAEARTRAGEPVDTEQVSTEAPATAAEDPAAAAAATADWDVQVTPEQIAREAAPVADPRPAAMPVERTDYPEGEAAPAADTPARPSVAEAVAAATEQASEYDVVTETNVTDTDRALGARETALMKARTKAAFAQAELMASGAGYNTGRLRPEAYYRLFKAALTTIPTTETELQAKGVAPDRDPKSQKVVEQPGPPAGEALATVPSSDVRSGEHPVFDPAAAAAEAVQAGQRLTGQTETPSIADVTRAEQDALAEAMYMRRTARDEHGVGSEQEQQAIELVRLHMTNLYRLGGGR